MRRAGFAAIGGVGSAAGLAQLYAATLPGSGFTIAHPDVFAEMAQQHSWGTDRVLDIPNCFGLVFMLPQPRQPFGGVRAYGHDGAGGALAFADPSTASPSATSRIPCSTPAGPTLVRSNSPASSVTPHARRRSRSLVLRGP